MMARRAPPRTRPVPVWSLSRPSAQLCAVGSSSASPTPTPRFVAMRCVTSISSE
jgi:hypothetical protein